MTVALDVPGTCLVMLQADMSLVATSLLECGYHDKVRKTDFAECVWTYGLPFHALTDRLWLPRVISLIVAHWGMTPKCQSSPT